MDNCDKCVHRRGIISENGFHYVCGLSWQAARKCMFGNGQHYEELPKYYWTDEVEDEKCSSAD